jgi:hypothetical protein
VLGAGDEAFSTFDGEAAFEAVEVGGAAPEEDVGVFQQDGAPIAVAEGDHLLRGEVADEWNAVGVVGDDGGIPRGRVLAGHVEAVGIEEERVFGAEAFGACVHAGDEFAVGSRGGVGESAGGVVRAAHEHGAKEVEPSVACAGDEAELCRRLELIPDRDLNLLLEAALGDDFHRGEEFLCAGDRKAVVGVFFVERPATLCIYHDGASSPNRRGADRLLGSCHGLCDRAGWSESRLDGGVGRHVGATMQNRKNERYAERSSDEKCKAGARPWVPAWA